jgi:outer membrane receptor for ferrienterochelin and colicins
MFRTSLIAGPRFVVGPRSMAGPLRSRSAAALTSRCAGELTSHRVDTVTRVRRWPARALLAAVLAQVLCTGAAHGQQAEKQEPDLTKLSLEDLTKVQIETVYGASKFGQKVTEAPSSITIVTADEIEKYGYRTLADLLKSVPGFYITYDRQDTFIGVRGISRPSDYNTLVLVLIDGHRVNENVYDGTYVNGEFPIDMDLIDRVEIIRGPGSSLYGTDAFFAVINIFTKRGRDFKGTEVSLSGGGQQTYQGRVTYGQQFKNGLEVLLSESLYQSKGNHELFYPEFNSPATNFGIARDADGSQFHNTYASASYRDFTFRAAYDWWEKYIPTGSYGTVFGDARTRSDDTRAYTDLEYQHTFEDKWVVDARAYYDWYWYNGFYIYDYAGTGVQPFTVNHDYASGDWWGLDLSVSRSLLEKHRVTVGTEEIFNTKQVQGNYDVQPYFKYLFDQRSSNVSAVYVQDEFSIRKNLLLSAGVRFDHYSTFGGTVNPRAALIYSPAENTSVKVLYGQAFRAPDDFELYYDAVGFEANPALRPTTVKTTELVFERYFHKYTSLSVSGFYNSIGGLISQTADPITGLIRFSNLEDVHGKGLDFQLSEKRPSGWEGRLSYTTQISRSSLGGDTLTNSPKHLGKINVIAPLLSKKLFASFEGQEVSRRETVKETLVGGFFVANATLLSKDMFGRLQASVSLYNLFDKRYADPVGNELRQDSILQDGRNFRVKLTYRF